MKKKLSSRQFDIMNILWKSNKPMLASEILNCNSELNINTVQSTLKSLISKGFIKISGVTYSGTVLARTYCPLISKEEYLQNLYNELGMSSDTNSLLISLIKQETSLEKLNELENILIETKKKLED